MAKTNTKIDPYTKRRDETDLQWRSRVARHEQAQRDRSEPLVPAEAMAHGDYADAFVRSDDDTIARVKLNRGGTPVMRWARDKRLSDTQMLAISHCLRLWALAGINPRVTGQYGERIPGGDHESERRVSSYVEALADLRRIKDYIPCQWFGIFENVCRFDEPAGIAGSRLGFGNRSAQDRAHTVVCMVADVIAMREGLVPVSYIRTA